MVSATKCLTEQYLSGKKAHAQMNTLNNSSKKAADTWDTLTMKAKIGQLVDLVPHCDAKDHSHTHKKDDDKAHKT